LGSLGFALADQFTKQLPCEKHCRGAPDLGGLTSHTGRYGYYLGCDRIGAGVGLAVDHDRGGVGRWRSTRFHHINLMVDAYDVVSFKFHRHSPIPEAGDHGGHIGAYI